MVPGIGGKLSFRSDDGGDCDAVGTLMTMMTLLCFCGSDSDGDMARPFLFCSFDDQGMIFFLPGMLLGV